MKKRKRIIAGMIVFLLVAIIGIGAMKNRKPVENSADVQNTMEGQIVEKNGTLIYEIDGVQSLSETGIHYYKGQWYYIENGVWRNDVTGLVTCDDIQYYVQDGMENWITSLVYINDVWYYIENGKVGFDYTGLVYYESNWWYVKDGILDWSYTGICEYNKRLWYVKEGRLDWNYNGTVEYEQKNYVVENGKAYLQK